MPKKIKNNKRSTRRDECQTPWYAVDPLIRTLKKYGINPLKEKIRVFEPFSGELLLAKKLLHEGFSVWATDILEGYDFFEIIKNKKTINNIDLIISNPPFSKKYDILKALYLLGKPFALLVPYETSAAKKAQDLFKKYGVIKIELDKRINYKMPFNGWKGTADFPSIWYLWLGQSMKAETITIYETIDPKGVRGDELTEK